MKTVLRLGAGVLLLILVGVFAIERNLPADVEVGDTAPASLVTALDGTETALGPRAGTVTIVNFWATWCPPCVQEMPSLEGLHAALGRDGLRVVGVSVDDDGGALRRFVKDAGIEFTVVRDPGGRKAAAAWGVDGYPETFVLDGAGRVLERYQGPARWDSPEAVAHFRELIAKAKAS